jgi:hypothetical protein
MPSIDFPFRRIPKGYKLPETPIVLTEGMSFAEVKAWICQELYMIYHCDKKDLIKEMMKEDVYNALIEANYDIEEMFSYLYAWDE